MVPVEIWKALIEHVLSWPVAVLVIGWMFRSSLRQFLQNIHTLKIKGGPVEFTGEANRQIEDANKATKDPLVAEPSAQGKLPIPTDIAERRKTVESYGGDYELLNDQMRAIAEQLDELQFTPEEKIRVLIRHLAAIQLLQRAETLYRLIFGSQMSALELMNHAGPQEEEAIKSIYERASNRSPRFYVNYSFEPWINFLLQQKVAIYSENRYAITVFGRAFLGFIVSQGLPKKAH